MKSSRSPLLRSRCSKLWLATLFAASGTAASAYTINITPGPRALFLQVGAGTMTAGPFRSGGVPGNNAAVDTASVTVPASAIGSGTAQPMTTDSTVTASPWDGFAFCNAPASTGQVYVGGFYRAPGAFGFPGTLTVSTPASLANPKGDTIAFNRIAWTATDGRGGVPTLPSGAFTGGTQTLLSVGHDSWFESCLAFRYLNTQIVPAGSFKGRATFTLSAP
jgi:hypothetical protein